jgi:hypothetical protein
MLTLLKSFVMISLCPIIILSPSFSQTSQTRRPGFYDLLRVLFQSQRKVGTLFGFIMMNSSTNNLGGRIPASLQAVFLASNRGHEVNTPPPRKVAFKTFSYILNLKSKRRGQYEKQGSKKAKVPTPVVVKVSWSTRRGTGPLVVPLVVEQVGPLVGPLMTRLSSVSFIPSPFFIAVHNDSSIDPFTAGAIYPVRSYNLQ